MDTFVQQLINGLNVGAIYALIALGYTMVYGILRLINFAHGDVYMVGAFAGFYIALYTGLAVGGPSLLSLMVVLLGVPSAALFGLFSVTLKVSFGSSDRSSTIGMAMVLLV